MAIYEKSVRLLMKDMVTDLAIKKGDRITKAQIIAWFNNKYPKIKLGTITAHLVRMSTNAKSRHHYSAKPIEDDLFYQLDGSTYRLYDANNDPSPVINGTQRLEEEEEKEEEALDSIQEKNEFAYEKDLQNFLSRNLHIIEPGISLPGFNS